MLMQKSSDPPSAEQSIKILRKQNLIKSHHPHQIKRTPKGVFFIKFSECFQKDRRRGNIFELVENARYIASAKEKGKKTAAHQNVSYWDYFVKTV